MQFNFLGFFFKCDGIVSGLILTELYTIYKIDVHLIYISKHLALPQILGRVPTKGHNYIRTWVFSCRTVLALQSLKVGIGSPCTLYNCRGTVLQLVLIHSYNQQLEQERYQN